MPSHRRFRIIQLIGIIYLSFLCFSLIGCSPPVVHKSLNVDPSQTTRPVTVSSMILHGEVKLRIQESHLAGPQGGLLWVLIDKSVNKSRGQESERVVAPLVEATADFDFRNSFWTALEKAVKTSNWLKLNRLERRPSVYTSDEISKIELPFLQIVTQHELSHDAKILIIQSNVRLYFNNKNVPDYFGYCTYFSNVISNNSNLEESIINWAKNSAIKYKTAALEGISENINMINYDLLSNPVLTNAEFGQDKTIKYIDPVSGFEVKHNVIIIEETNERIIVREKGGNLFSIAKSQLL